MVKRVYVEKRRAYAVKAMQLKEEIAHFLGISSVTDVRLFIRYDVEHVSGDVFEQALRGVFAEPPLDFFYLEELPAASDAHVFGIEPLPGQFDQRADSAAQCLRFIDEEAEPIVQCADIYMITGNLKKEELKRIRDYCLNPVDSREAAMEKPETLTVRYPEPPDVETLTGMIRESDKKLMSRYDRMGLAMTAEDFVWIRDYFRDTEKRDPTLTEIKVLDTYWSDHCRHTTFSTRLTQVSVSRGEMAAPIRLSYKRYLDIRRALFKTNEQKEAHPVCFMDVALAGMRKLREDGILTDMENSTENNACSVVVPIEVVKDDGTKETEEWLLFFKNETHNHPTEIEPYGGAATCLGGAIRDPLSGRGYVYQAMRVTGAGDPTVPVTDTLPGKLPQKKLVKEAAHGYSSYGNQIGLATGLVREIYHPGYVAKRMEIGAVVGAARRDAVRRVEPSPGDVIILVGGRTGRDGIGGATGSSKSHSMSSLTSCGAEVQKGNPPTERALQRLFRREEVARLILKCNDFGAGGVAVAIGELADGLMIDLDKVPRKYAGLDGTELAISESQERMAVVVSASDEQMFLSYAADENLEATSVARVTGDGRLVMQWRGVPIVDLSREFLNTNGAPQFATARIPAPNRRKSPFRGVMKEEIAGAVKQGNVRDAWLTLLCDLNVCSQKGLSAMFDSTIGAGTVVLPEGGRYQRTVTDAMVAKFPVRHGESGAVSLMSYGFDPYVSEWSPYHGAVYAVLLSVARLIASGCALSKIHLTLQEYFRRMDASPESYGEVFAALLGALEAQMSLNIAAIGGKDSMSGTFDDLNVPPTLVSFAVGHGYAHETVTAELKHSGNSLVSFRIERDDTDLPVFSSVITMYNEITRLMREGHIVSCKAVDAYGEAMTLSQMAFGNEFGVTIEDSRTPEELFANGMGNLIAEVTPTGLVSALRVNGAMKLGVITEEGTFLYRQVSVLMPEALQCWSSRLSRIFPPVAQTTRGEAGRQTRIGTRDELIYRAPEVYVCRFRTARPRVFIPVFPGTNCEYDLERAFKKAGAETETKVFRNLHAEDIRGSAYAFADAINEAQIVMFPGGFSAGDEPDGSAKFFATAFRNAHLKEALMRLLNERDGLVLGICNGFQALIKLGLVPYGDIRVQTDRDPTLTYNTIGRHISAMAHLRVTSNRSPWLSLTDPGEIYLSPVSHGEGRFVAEEDTLKSLMENGQIATRYCDPEGNITMDPEWNLNGSYGAIEGITSPDGRVYGKMAHAERQGKDIQINVPGKQDMRIFEAGVRYFQ